MDTGNGTEMLSLAAEGSALTDEMDGDLALPEIEIDIDMDIPSFTDTSKPDEADQTQQQVVEESGVVTPLDANTTVVEESGQVLAMDIDASGVVEDSGTLDDIVIPGLNDDDPTMVGLSVDGMADQIVSQGVVDVLDVPVDDLDEDQLDENGEKIPIYLDLSRMQKWRVEDVCEYLKNSQFGAIYVDSFYNQQISGRILYEVDDARLTDFGVKSAIHRFRILRDILDAKDIARWEQCTQQGGDGGTTLSRFMRLNAEDLALWCTYVTTREEIGLTMSRNKPEMTGYDLIHTTDLPGLLTSARIAPSDHHKITTELNRLKMQNNDALQIVEQVWKQRRDLANRCYFLKPQHLVTPTLTAGRVAGATSGGGVAGAGMNGMANAMYQQQQPMYGDGAVGASGAHQQQPVAIKSQHTNKLIGKKRSRPNQSNGDVSRVSSTANYHGPNVLEWDNATVLTFVSGFPFGDRYLRHFRTLQIDGPTLIKLTANTLEDVVRVTVKTHIRQMCKAIDDLRDMALQEFIGRPTTQSWMASNPPKRQRTNTSSAKRSRNPSNSAMSSGNVSSASSTALNAMAQSVTQQQQQDVMMSQAGYGMGGGMTAGGMGAQTGAVPKCQLCGATTNIMRCSNCKNAFYCSREHQLQDWPQHQAKCVA